MIIQCVPPLDNYNNVTVPLSSWLKWGDNPGNEHFVHECNVSEFIRKMNMLREAWSLVVNHPNWENELRCEPCVGYDPTGDCEFFIFKMENNGTTLVVSDTGFKFAEEF